METRVPHFFTLVECCVNVSVTGLERGYRVYKYLLLAIALCAGDDVLAHEDREGGGGFMVGLLHPVLGFDHFLAMLSVGILSVQIGGRAVWVVPTTFVSVMVVGNVLGFFNLEIPMVETGIALSVLALGIALAASQKLPIWTSMLFVGCFAIFHGHAHGTEMPLIANPYFYATGFVTGTAVIHLLGVSIGFTARKPHWGAGVLRYVGAAIAGIGFHILVLA